jgi:hypothetical protein
VAVLVVLLVAAVVGGYYLTRDPSSPTADPGTEQTPDDKPTRTRNPSPSPTESEPPPSETTAPPASTPDPGEQETEEDDPPPTDTDDPAAFVAEYYSYLPDDTETSWQMLSPELQNEVGRGSYEGFWASVADVTVDDVTSDGDGAVLVTITYTTANGSEQETRRLIVGEAGGGLLITDDQGAV